MQKLIAQYWKVLIGVSLGISLIAFLQIQFHGTNEQSIRFLIKWTAKMSVACFSLAFGISSVFHFFKNDITAMIFNYRPHLGLAFGVFHTFHLLFLVILQTHFHPVFTLAKTSSLIGGGMAYLFMYLMMITTFAKGKTMMHPGSWRILHIIGGYWIWGVFFWSYYKQVFYQGQGYFLFILISMVLVFRIFRMFFRERDLVSE